MQTVANASAKGRKKESVFDLDDKHARDRNLLRIVVGVTLWFTWSVTAWMLTVYQVQETDYQMRVFAASAIKYAAILSVVYYLARSEAANYLGDIFEVEDKKITAAFIEEAAFGGRKQQITIEKGSISEADQKSPIVLIGGPGKIQVNLDSVALLEKLNGEPEIIFAQKEPWEIGCFERIREIGQSNEAGKREFAIINLRDQFVKDISVFARTKDGIRIKIEGIKALFSIMRDARQKPAVELEKHPFTFDPKAVHTLVYDQCVVIRSYDAPTGVKFPWDTTAIHLVKLELEEQIKSHLLSETFASMNQNETDELIRKEKENERAKYHTLGKTFEEKAPAPQPLTLIPRTTIRDYFFSEAFQKKAAKLGIAIHWIDIGTWSLDENIVLEKVKEARELNAENRKRKAEIERRRKQRVLEALLELINKKIILNFEQDVDATHLEEVEWAALAEMIRKNPELSNDHIVKKLTQQRAKHVAVRAITHRMVTAFRRELLAARQLIQAEDRSPVEKEKDLKNINNALYHLDHYVT